MKEFNMSGNKIIYQDGWFVYVREDGRNSVLTRRAARRVEEEHFEYQAFMDVGRGGMHPDAAYAMRGFSKRKDCEYIFTAEYETEALAECGTDQQFSETLVIPEKVGDVEITCVSSESFAGLEDLREVILPHSIRIIERGAFQDCRNLQSIQMPQNVSVQEDAFSGTGVLETDSRGVSYVGTALVKADTSLQGEYCVREGTCSITERAFYQCADLTSVRLPEGISRLERGTFKNCIALSKVHLPDSLQFIAFDSLENTEIANRFWEGDEPALYIDHWLICYKPDFSGELSIRPGTIGIADSFSTSMENRELSRIHIPQGMRYLGMGCFERCHNITQLELPEGIEDIGQSALRGCTGLTQVVFPQSLKTLDIWNIMHCDKIEKVTFLNAETDIIWPAVTDREDKETIVVAGYPHSTAEAYCREYGEKYHLEFCEI